MDDPESYNLSTLGLSARVQAGEKIVVLVVGDGDFSYSFSLATLLRQRGWDDAVQLVATSLDSFETMSSRYLRFHRIYNALQRMHNVRVLFGVDATKLEESAASIFSEHHRSTIDRIVFNFPHYGGKSKVHINRKLLFDFFQSATRYLEPEQGEIWVSLTAGQGGTPAERLKRLTWGDTWQVQDHGAAAGLLMKDVHHADQALALLQSVDEDLAYSCTGFRSKDEVFRTTENFSHVFAFPHHLYCPRARYPLKWSFSIAFDIDIETFTPDTCFNIIRDLLPGLVFEVSPFSKFYDAKRGTHTRTWDMVWIAETIPLSKRQCHDKMVEMKERLDQLALRKKSERERQKQTS